MRNPSLRHRSHRGAVMVMALVIMGIVTFGFVAWVRLLGQRGRAGELEEQNVRRRLAALNAEAASREYLLMKVMTAASDTNGLALYDPLGNGWGTAKALLPWTGAALATKERAALNPFSPAWDNPYGKELTFTAGYKNLTFSNETPVWTDDSAKFTGTVNSRNAMLGGDLLIAQTKKVGTALVAPSLSGNINVYGGIIQFAVGGGYSVRRTATRDSFIQLSGGLPSNLASTPLNSGTGYSGEWNVINNTSNTANSLLHRLEAARDASVAGGVNARASRIVTLAKSVASNDAGITWSGTVSTSSVNQATITSYEGVAADTPNVVVKDGISELILKAPPASLRSDAGTRQVQVIISDQTTSVNYQALTSIRLRGTNPRRTLLALKSTSASSPEVTIFVEDSVALSQWNLIILAENVRVKFSFPGSPYLSTALTMVGGIQTDSTLSGPTGSNTLNLKLETITSGLDQFAQRMGWVETYLGRDEKL